MGKTSVDSMSSCSKSGRDCDPLGIAIRERVICGRGREWWMDSGACLETPQKHASRSILTASHHIRASVPLCPFLTNRQMQAQPTVQQPQPVKIYNAVYSSVQVCL